MTSGLEHLERATTHADLVTATRALLEEALGPAVADGFTAAAARIQSSDAESLRRAKNSAEAANAELEAFSHSVAHDLRAPLRAIAGFAELLEQHAPDQLDANSRDCLARIIGATERMAAIIDALLTLSRVTRAELRREVVDLRAIADTIVERLRRDDPGRVVEFVNDAEQVVTGDPQLLTVLLDNLLGNAWKFTSRNATRRARIELGRRTSAAGSPIFFVRDDGAGFDMKYVNKLFVPFQRLHGQADYAGTGIGLATVARVIARHDGRIWAEGDVDRGATFYFVLEPPR